MSSRATSSSTGWRASPDEKIVEELTLVRGIGRWTAEMFLIFQLGRLDVWPVDDLRRAEGIRDASTASPERPTAKVLEPLGDPYRPLPEVAAWYCWRAADTDLPVANRTGSRDPLLAPHDAAHPVLVLHVAGLRGERRHPDSEAALIDAAGVVDRPGRSACRRSCTTNCDPYTWGSPSLIRTRSSRQA